MIPSSSYCHCKRQREKSTDAGGAHMIPKFKSRFSIMRGFLFFKCRTNIRNPFYRNITTDINFRSWVHHYDQLVAVILQFWCIYHNLKEAKPLRKHDGNTVFLIGSCIIAPHRSNAFICHSFLYLHWIRIMFKGLLMVSTYTKFTLVIDEPRST